MKEKNSSDKKRANTSQSNDFMNIVPNKISSARQELGIV